MAKKRKKKKRLRLKSSVKRFLIYFIFFFIMGIYTIKESFSVIEQIKYQDTYEYKIIQIGYPTKEAKKLVKVLPEKKLKLILEENEYEEKYYKIVTEKYYIPKNLDKYLEYLEYHDISSYKDLIAIVNVKANLGWYNETIPSNIDDGYMVLVNKFYYLPKDYERIDLQKASLMYSYDGNSAAKIVLEKFEEMREDVEKELGVRLMINSSYRSYKDQEEIYNSFKKVSLKYADSYAARPGHSEHQTGLAIDITSLENKTVDTFKKSAEYEWLKNNCHRYGFILRYPEGKEHITGYSTESWHFRYVGEKVAKKIFEEQITLDEYYAYYIAK